MTVDTDMCRSSDHDRRPRSMLADSLTASGRLSCATTVKARTCFAFIEALP